MTKKSAIICIYVIKHKPEEVRSRFNSVTGQLCVSSITVAELFFGAENSSKPDHNRMVVENFLSRLEILDYDTEAASQYGSIKATLSKQGKIIGENDLHIAAHARSRGLIVVTNNMKEFSRVPALQVENWVNSAR